MPADLPEVCERARAWLSAYRDAEAADDAAARDHLRGCAGCAAWSAALDRMTRQARLRARAGPDVTAAALAAWDERAGGALRAEGAHRARRRPRQELLARAVLAVAGVTGLALAALGLADVFGYVEAAGLHLGWELYSFEAALALGFLLAARAPRRHLPGLLPVTVAVVLLTLVPSAGALASSGSDAVREASHAPVMLGLAGLLLLADAQGHGARRRRTRADGAEAVVA